MWLIDLVWMLVAVCFITVQCCVQLFPRFVHSVVIRVVIIYHEADRTESNLKLLYVKCKNSLPRLDYESVSLLLGIYDERNTREFTRNCLLRWKSRHEEAGLCPHMSVLDKSDCFSRRYDRSLDFPWKKWGNTHSLLILAPLFLVCSACIIIKPPYWVAKKSRGCAVTQCSEGNFTTNLHCIPLKSDLEYYSVCVIVSNSYYNMFNKNTKKKMQCNLWRFQILCALRSQTSQT